MTFNKLAQYKAPLVFVLVVLSIALYTSCANVSSPTGGDKDSIAPVPVKMFPLNNETEVEEFKVEITFDEYVKTDGLNEILVISPPTIKRPDIFLRGKTLVVKVDDEMIPDRTYSLDFKNGIVDNNESNELENFRVKFSNYETLDTLRVKGYAKDVFTNLPVEEAYIAFYNHSEDSLFSTQRPDYIAKTNAEGYFIADNLKPGSYRVFALVDDDRNLMYSQESEMIAYLDTLIIPSSRWIPVPDTLVHHDDTITSSGHAEYYPEPFHLKMFTEDRYNPYLLEVKREEKDRFHIYLNEPQNKGFEIRPLNFKLDEQTSYKEVSKTKDSIEFWLTDTLVSNIDTLSLAIQYTLLDSIKQPYLKLDTFNLYYTKPKTGKNKKKNEVVDTVKIVPHFEFLSNVKNKFDLGREICFKSEDPIENFNLSAIDLQIKENDSTFIDTDFTVEKISNRLYIIHHEVLSNTSYLVKIDSAAAVNKMGEISMGFEKEMTTQDRENYGKLSLNIQEARKGSIVQLLKSSKSEEVVQEKILTKASELVVFEYLNAGKYLVKLIDDSNGNGIWDTGSFSDKIAPEEVYYIPQIFKIRSNWDDDYEWNPKLGTSTIKNIEDEDSKDSDKKNKSRNQR